MDDHQDMLMGLLARTRSKNQIEWRHAPLLLENDKDCTLYTFRDKMAGDGSDESESAFSAQEMMM